MCVCVHVCLREMEGGHQPEQGKQTNILTAMAYA